MVRLEALRLAWLRWRLSEVALVVASLGTIISVWAPPLIHYSATAVWPAGASSRELLASLDPDLPQIQQFRVLHEPGSGKQADATNGYESPVSANEIEEFIRRGFSRDDLAAGGVTRQLWYAGFGVPDHLLHLYRRSGDRQALRKAVEFVARWNAFERRLFYGKGFVWNDHAIAERVFVLVDLIAELSRHGLLDDWSAAELSEQLGRCLAFLVKPSHFTFRTNHGVMQNLALLHVAAAFRAEPHARPYAQLGWSRLISQIDYYVTGNGIVTEHSADYHALGSGLLARFEFYGKLLGKEIPDAVAEKIAKMRVAEILLRRPDGSLPMLGDTVDGPRPQLLSSGHDAAAPGPVACADPSLPRYFVGAREWIVSWWCTRHSRRIESESQLVFSLMNFPERGHFKSNQLSTLFWSDGIDWLSDAGYVSYADPRRAQSDAWTATSAPHALGEPYRSTLRVHAGMALVDGDFRFFEASRQNRMGDTFERQIVEIGGHAWIVLDFAAFRSPARLEVLWRGSSEVRWKPGDGDTRFDLEARMPQPMRRHLRARIAASKGAMPSFELIRGGNDDLSGWGLERGNLVPTTTLRLRTDPAPNASVAFAWWHDESPYASALAQQVTLEAMGRDRWTLTLGSGSATRIERAGTRLRVESQEFELVNPPRVNPDDIDREYRGLRSASEMYPRYRELYPYRVRLTWWLLGALSGSAIVIFVLGRRARGTAPIAALALAGCWIAIGLVVHFWYFAD